MKSFEAQLADFASETLRDIRHVVAESSQDVVEAAQTTQLGVTRGASGFEEGKIPVGETADLVNSLVSGLNGSVLSSGSGSYGVAIAGFKLGDVIEFGWTMDYAMRIEHGFTGTDELGRSYQQAGRHFVGANVERWSEIVDENVREVARK